VARLPVRLPPRPDVLAGREELLVRLDALLAGGDGLQVVVLSGLGGVGKTSVAVEYAHRHLAEVGVAWLVAAEDPAVLAAELAELSAQLGDRNVIDPREPVASLHAVLAAYPGRWLLVFDNCIDEASARRFLPPAGTGQVLVTSQSPHWRAGRVLEVPVLDEDVATGFLINRAGDLDEGAAAALATELGGLPLALEQAAAYIRATSGSLAGYLGLYRQRRAELLDRGLPSDHPASVAATIGLALARLHDQAPTAAGLLRLLACMAPEPVPVGALLSDTDLAGQLEPDVARALGPLLGDALATADAVAALRSYSLVTAAARQMLLIHRLVQDISLDLASAETAGQWRAAAAALTEAAVPLGPSEPSTWPTFTALLPHAQAVLDLTSGGMWRITQYLGFSGNYSAARDLARHIANAHAQSPDYGPEHALTLDARQNAARWSGDAGDPTSARDLTAELLPIRERVLGPEHPDTLVSRANLAYYTGMAGDPAAARDLYADLLPIVERIEGPEHPDTLIARGNLARWTGNAGDPAAARDLYADLLPIEQHLHGAEHPDTVIDRHNLAHYIGMAGDPAAARDLYAELLPIEERILGPEHPHTLSAHSNLATWTGEAGDPSAARDLHADLLPIRERIQGAEHPATLNDRANLAHWIGQAGDPAAARDLHAELLPIRERIQGAEHPDTLNDRANLAHWTGEAGDPAAARDLYAELLPIRERVQGAEHPDTLITRANLAHWTERDAP
jgi:hypothetical protein